MTIIAHQKYLFFRNQNKKEIFNSFFLVCSGLQALGIEFQGIAKRTLSKPENCLPWFTNGSQYSANGWM